MSYSIAQIKEHLTGMGHGGTLKKVRNINPLFERAANNMLASIQPIETMRLATLSQTVHNKLYNYSLPNDFRSLIDLYPQAERGLSDQAGRRLAEHFDRRKSIDENKISIEGDGASKIIRINWDVRASKTLHNMNSLTGNGTWSAVGTATNVALDEIYKYSGSGSIKFDQAASGDGIENTTMSAVDLSDEDEIGEAIFAFFIKDATELAKLTSVSFLWGNDLTANYWTGVAQTAQADGTAFRVGWNTVKVPWSTATETGTVNPATINSAQVTFTSTSAIVDIRVDNILFSIGSPFDIKYYGKYLFQNSSGTWITQPSDDADVVVLDNDAINIYLYYCLKEMAHQMEGSDSSFDISFANRALYGNPDSPDPIEQIGLIAKYRSMYPNQSKKAVATYGSLRSYKRFNRGYGRF